MKFNKIIIYGYLLHEHTHSYVNQGFYKAFKHLGYETLWINDKNNVSNINFDNCLFLAEGSSCKNIPINKSSYYILHNCDGKQFESIPTSNKINLQFFHKDVLNRNLTKINDWTFVGHDIIHFPWATDLLPHEFNENDARNEIINRECVWVGSYDQGNSEFQNHSELDPYFDLCRQNKISVRLINPWSNPVSSEEGRRLIHNAYLAPAINGPWQRDQYYLSCRLFKNISYGHLGITNNFYANKIFDNRLVYDYNPQELFRKSIEKKNDPNVVPEMKWLINEVASKHTYINRINAILDCFK